MRKCIRCDKEIPDTVDFCPECGARQSEPAQASAQPPMQAQPANTTQVQQQMPHASSGNALMEAGNMYKAAYAGAALAAVSVFLPLVTALAGMASISVMDINGALAAAVVAFAAIAAYFQKQEQVDMMPIIGTGFLIVLLVFYYEYSTAMTDMMRSFGNFGRMAKAAFTFSAGLYAYIAGTLMMCVAGSGCLAARLGLPVDLSGIMAAWKAALQRTVLLGSTRLPGWVLSLVVAGIIGLIAKNIN